MKKVFFFLIVFSFCYTAYSQTKQYSITVFSGAAFPGYNLNHKLKTGSFFGAEYQNCRGQWAFLCELDNNFFNGSFITKASIGPRLYLINDKISPFVDLTGGLFLKKLSETSVSIGISPGIGTTFVLSNNFGFSLKAKWNVYLGKGDGGIGDYSNIIAGIKYNF